MASQKKSMRGLSMKAAKGQHKVSEPETADGYLEAGVKLEEAGEKWRAGDAVKSLRFFVKAIDQYDAGIIRFPGSFDLAYNKARLQYDVSQQPRLFEQLPMQLVDMLKVAAESHLHALWLDDTNSDNLFNLSQVYSSLADATLDRDGNYRDIRAEALKLLHGSLGFSERCLGIQESQYAQAQQVALQHSHAFPDRNPDLSCPESSAPAEVREDEIWASIVEPVTTDTLLDTCLAQVEVLKTLCGLTSLEHTEELRKIEDDFRDKLSGKIDKYSQLPERVRDAALSKADFWASVANARYRLRVSDLSTYENDLDASILGFENDAGTDAPVLCLIADARIDFNSSIEERQRQEKYQLSPGDLTKICAIRWKHITRALDNYTVASRSSDVPNLARIHISRGDCEMLRLRLREAPFNYPLAERSGDTLVRNASIYYGTAAKVLSRDMTSSEARDDKIEVDAKAAVVAAWMAAAPEMLKGSLIDKGPEVRQILEDMQEQGLLGEESWLQMEKLFKET